MHRGILLVAGGIALFVAGVVFSGSRDAFGVVPVTPYEADVNKDTRVNAIDLGQVAQKFGQVAPTATATPVQFGAVRFIGETTIANHELAWIGSYRPSSCPEATLFIYAMGLEGPGGTFDLLLSASDDGVIPTGTVSNIGNSSTEGSPGFWHLHRKQSTNQTGANYETAQFSDDSVAFLLVGAFANQAGRFRAEVHCAGYGE